MRRNTIVGGLVWCGLLAAALVNALDLNWLELLFLLAPLVIVPLGLYLTSHVENGTTSPFAERLARMIHAPAALLAVASFFWAPGRVSAGFATAWLVFCGLIALGGVRRILRGALARWDSVFPAVSFLYLPVGGAWLVASRLGLGPLGFQEPIVLLTAMHFHYAGFAAPLIARSAARALARRSGNKMGMILFRIAAAGVLTGPCVLAMGFVVGPRVKLLAALVLAASEIGLAISFLFALGAIARPTARVFIVLAGASVAFSMVLAAVWAVGEYPLHPFVHLAEMERWHGTANALGFTLCGLLGWSLAGKDQFAERRPEQ